ncbi:MAG: hypothetical protein H0V74_06375 [Chloroflexi bacterium]|nr:hypothetical protein [Chloroflexota bacterium]
MPQRFITPLAWDRRAQVIASLSQAQDGSLEYQVITVGAGGQPTRIVIGGTALPSDVFITASPDGVWAAGLWRSENVVRYWPIASFDARKELRPAAGTGAGVPIWSPDSRGMAVVVAVPPTAQRLEIWNLDGSRRTLRDSFGQQGGLFFQPDGTVLYVGCCTAVDVATGHSVDIMLGQSERIRASVLIK